MYSSKSSNAAALQHVAIYRLCKGGKGSTWQEQEQQQEQQQGQQEKP